ncbi:MAG: hypothetical protein AB7F89_14505 [Pirellulaceae bacterium]
MVVTQRFERVTQHERDVVVEVPEGTPLDSEAVTDALALFEGVDYQPMDDDDEQWENDWREANSEDGEPDLVIPGPRIKSKS